MNHRVLFQLQLCLDHFHDTGNQKQSNDSVRIAVIHKIVTQFYVILKKKTEK